LAECLAMGGIGRRRWSVLVAQADEQSWRSRLVVGPRNQTDGDACIGEGLIDEPPGASVLAGDERDRPDQRSARNVEPVIGLPRPARHGCAHDGFPFVERAGSAITHGRGWVSGVYSRGRRRFAIASIHSEAGLPRRYAGQPIGRYRTLVSIGSFLV
jgi:hypothetical protein